MLGLQMKKEQKWLGFWTWDLQIHLEGCIQKKKIVIHGGHIWQAQEKEISGWRIDYFVISDRIDSRIEGADIYPEVMGSDHCPVGLEIDL